MSVTIKDIARAAGVSHTTVSRALRGHPAIADSTKRKIRRMADELGYVPNTVARGLKTSRSGVLGVVVRRIVDPFFGGVLEGIEEVLYARGYSLFLAASHRQREREEAIVRAMSERRVEGVIICSTRVGAAHRRQLGRFGVPTVLVNNQAPEEMTHSIYHDDALGSRQLTRHLIDLGHRRIAYLGNARAGRTSEDRFLGYRQALAQAGLADRPAYAAEGPNGTPAGGAAGVHGLLKLARRPTAIVCYNDMMAMGAIQALRKAGLRVPADCSVTGFDDIELAAYYDPPLTTFTQPKKEIGRKAAQMILRMLDDPSTADEQDIVVLRGQLCARESTGPVPHAYEEQRVTDQGGIEP